MLMMLAAQSLDAIDDANLALTTCGFKAFQEADRQNQSLSQFMHTLDSRCADQMARMRELSVDFDMKRKGLPRSAAEGAANEVMSYFRGRFASQYSNRDRTKGQMKALERAIQNKGDSNAQ